MTLAPVISLAAPAPARGGAGPGSEVDCRSNALVNQPGESGWGD
jgi:hypothetical protein